MSDVTIPDPVLTKSHGIGMSAFARAVLLAGLWLPFFVLVIFFLPMFTPIFKKLAERGELPALTQWFLMYARLNAATFGLPMVGSLALLIGSDLGLASAAAHWKRGSALHGAWHVAVILLALFACCLFVFAMLQPIFRLGHTVS